MLATLCALALSSLVTLPGGLAFGAEPDDAEPQTRIYALIVANNSSVDANVEPLQFADDDGARYFELFSSLAHETRLLTTLDADSQRIFPDLTRYSVPPERKHLRETVEELAGRIRNDRAQGRRTELYLVFSGHGNVDASGEGYLSLADGQLRRSDLYREVIRPLDAHFTHLIIDACHAYYMVRSRGSGPAGQESWQDDRSGETLDAELSRYLAGQASSPRESMSTVGVILSTSGTAEVHEWSRFRAGVFSHQLRSGLLGAADVDGDGQVTYRELEAYLVAANARVTNPRARIHVFVQPPAQDRQRPLVAIDGYRDATVFEIPAGNGGRFHVEDARGLRYADLHVARETSASLVLLQKPTHGEPYFFHTDSTQAAIPTSAAAVQSTALAFSPLPGQARGSIDEAFRTSLYGVAFGPSFYAGFLAGRDQLGAAETPAARQSEAALPGGWQLMASYGVSPSTLGEAGLQHQLHLGLTFMHRTGLGVGIVGGYGLSHVSASSNPSALTIHRIALGAEGSYSRTFADRFTLGPRARLFHQAVFLSADQWQVDPIGLRSEGALAMGWTPSNRMGLALEAGLSADLITRAGLERNTEEWFFNPFVRLGLTWSAHP